MGIKMGDPSVTAAKLKGIFESVTIYCSLELYMYSNDSQELIISILPPSSPPFVLTSMSVSLAQPRLLDISRVVLLEDSQVFCSETTAHRQH